MLQYQANQALRARNARVPTNSLPANSVTCAATVAAVIDIDNLQNRGTGRERAVFDVLGFGMALRALLHVTGLGRSAAIQAGAVTPLRVQ